jgi:hypothetical protein
MASYPVPVLDIDYPEGPMADEIEARIAATLPAIPGLDETQTLAERVNIYQALAQEQRTGFIETYGNEIGAERRAEPRVRAVIGEEATHNGYILRLH